MSQFFDHVKCPSCGAAFDPEKVATRGREMTCPSCHASLALADLFGLSAAWAEEEQPNLSLEDAIPKAEEGKPSAAPKGGPKTPAGAKLPGRPIDQAPMGALDVLKQLKKER
jgi:hypothetical protein